MVSNIEIVKVWDSRTIHWNVSPVGKQTRFATYVCYCPRALMNDEDLAKKREIFQARKSTTHWPVSLFHFPFFGLDFEAFMDISTDMQDYSSKMSSRLTDLIITLRYRDARMTLLIQQTAVDHSLSPRRHQRS